MTGGTLADRLQAGALSVSETAAILQRIGSALERAHEKGVVHRDLKPSNIMFDDYGDAFLADFGIARLVEGAVTLTGESVIGTPAYMSPEQIHGDKEIDGRSDIYALGVICFEMLTGEPPYQDSTPAKVMMRHVIDPVPQIRQARPDLPEGMDTLIARTMAKEPDERYARAGEVADSLSSLTADTAETPPVNVAAESAAVAIGLQEAAAASGEATVVEDSPDTEVTTPPVPDEADALPSAPAAAAMAQAPESASARRRRALPLPWSGRASPAGSSPRSQPPG
jgi:serine/threonine-protein kinase